LVFTLPAAVADIARQNERVVYDMLFKAAAEATLTIAADPRHLGAKISITAVLHSWGSAITHHPHIHMIVPGGGLSADGERWIASRPGFFLPVRVLSRLFRRLFLGMLATAHAEARLAFFGLQETLAVPRAFARLRRLRQAAAPGRMGDLCQSPARRPQASAGLSGALHSPDRNLQAAPDPRRRRRCHLHLQDYCIDGPGRFKTMTLATMSLSGAS
jgi:hypothetical protein